MLRVLSVVILILGWSFIAQGQEEEKNFRIGILGTSEVSWFSSDNSTSLNDGAKISLKGGILVDYRLLENYYFSTGINFNNMRGAIEYTESNIPFETSIETYILNNDTEKSNVTVDYQINYLEIPLGLKLRTNEIGYFTYHATFGLRTLFNTKALASANQQAIDKENISKEVNFFHLGGFIGAGVEYAISRNFIVHGGLHYNAGFTDMTSTNKKSFSDKVSLNGIALQVGVLF